MVSNTASETFKAPGCTFVVHIRSTFVFKLFTMLVFVDHSCEFAGAVVVMYCVFLLC